MNEKEILRKIMKQRLNSQKQFERRKQGRVIQKKLFAQKEFLTSHCVMLYVSKGTGEVESGPIVKKALNMGKEVVLPVTLARGRGIIKPVRFKNLKQGLRKGSYGIYEPKRSGSGKSVRIKDIGLVVVPGLAFDRNNNRLGRGKGYYDSFLRTLANGTPTIGLGFRFQLLKKIPATKRDTPLTKVITN